jgi:hypothetical protein
MSDSAELERGYRRLLACYPRAYRHDSEQEILGVLMDSAWDGQRRPGLAESADLIRGAFSMRLRPRARLPRAMRGAIRVMCAGAAVELAALITYVMTASRVRSSMAQADPAQWHALLIHLTAVEVAAPAAVVVWLVMAWANGRGYDWARGLSTAFLCLITASLLFMLGEGGAVHAPAELIATAAVWLVGLATVVLIFTKASSQYYRHEPAQQ